MEKISNREFFVVDFLMFNAVANIVEFFKLLFVTYLALFPWMISTSDARKLSQVGAAAAKKKLKRIGHMKKKEKRRIVFSHKMA